MTANDSSQKGISYSAALKFFITDKNFLNNALIGSLYTLIPIIGPMILMGWHCEIIQRLVKRHSNPIPKIDFNDFVYFLGRGAVPFLSVFLFSLPFGFILAIFIYASIFGSVIFISSLTRQVGNPFPMFLVAVGIMLLIFFLILLPINILLSSVILRAELTEDFGKVFDLEKVFSLFKRTWKDFLLVYLVMIPLGLLFVMGGMLLFFIGIYPVAVWLNVTYLHLRWQVYEKYLSAGGEAIPIQTKSGPLPSETPRPLAPPPPAPART